MNSIGFPRTKMPLERRIAVVPQYLSEFPYSNKLFFEQNYGELLGFSDEEYLNEHANIVPVNDAYQCEIICQPKFDEGDFHFLKEGKTVFGWLHLASEGEFTQRLVEKKITAIAWELIYRDGSGMFQDNNYITGKIGVLSSIGYSGKLPENSQVAVIGSGCVGKTVITTLKQLNVPEIDIYNSKNMGDIKKKINQYDIIYNCARTDSIILTTEDLKHLKMGALIVSIGSFCIEGVEAGDLLHPVSLVNRGSYQVYCVPNIPSICYKDASKFITQEIIPYLEQLITGNYSPELEKAIVIDQGHPIKERLAIP